MRVLFLCSRNRLRSPTAENLFSGRPDLDVRSAGLSPDADEIVTPELIEWADIIFVMEAGHRAMLSRSFGRLLKNKKIVCLQIPDNFGYMAPDLIELLTARVTPHFR